MANTSKSSEMTPEEILPYITELIVYPEGYETVEDYNYRSFGIQVFRRADGKYSLKQHLSLWNGKKWEDNNSPKNATTAFKKRTRFELADAVREAKAIADDVTVMGRTFKDYLAFRDEVQKKEESCQAAR